jgi:hypothetical protein
MHTPDECCLSLYPATAIHLSCHSLPLVRQPAAAGCISILGSNFCTALFTVCYCCAAASHTTLVLLQHGHSVVMLDNLSNSFERVFEHMKKIAGDKADKMKFVQVGGQQRQQQLLGGSSSRTAAAAGCQGRNCLIE